MKNTLKFASLSLVLSVIAATGANAASSVRSFGGANTFDSVASASESKVSAGAVRATSGTTAGRGASLRVTPSAKKTGTSVKATAGTTSGRGSSMPRLSFGGHIGANKVVAGGSSVKPGTSGTPSGGVSSDAFDGVVGDLEGVTGTVQELQVIVNENSAAIEQVRTDVENINQTINNIDSSISEERVMQETDEGDALRGAVQAAASARDAVDGSGNYIMGYSGGVPRYFEVVGE